MYHFDDDRDNSIVFVPLELHQTEIFYRNVINYDMRNGSVYDLNYPQNLLNGT